MIYLPYNGDNTRIVKQMPDGFADRISNGGCSVEPNDMRLELELGLGLRRAEWGKKTPRRPTLQFNRFPEPILMVDWFVIVLVKLP